MTTWEHYTIEAYADADDGGSIVALVCRDDDTCEWAEERPSYGPYFTLGQLHDLAEAHHADHIAGADQ